MTTTTPTFSRTDHQRRLRNAVKRLVIELGYLEHCLAAGLQDATFAVPLLVLTARYSFGVAAPTIALMNTWLAVNSLTRPS